MPCRAPQPGRAKKGVPGSRVGEETLAGILQTHTTGTVNMLHKLQNVYETIVWTAMG
jgi:hypothetical protein